MQHTLPIAARPIINYGTAGIRNIIRFDNVGFRSIIFTETNRARIIVIISHGGD